MPETKALPSGIDVPGLYLMLGEIRAELRDVRTDTSETRADMAALRVALSGAQTEQATITQRVAVLEDQHQSGASRRWTVVFSTAMTIVGYSVAQLGSTLFGHNAH